MKIRYGFVSNSSTSSFTCEVCGANETGFDCSPNKLGFLQCEYGHIFCEEEVIGETIEYVESNDYGTCISVKNCPICTFSFLSNYDAARYLLKEYGVSRDKVFEEIKKINKRRKKLHDFEYVKYVFNQESITEESFLKMLKEKYKSYKDYLQDLRK